MISSKEVLDDYGYFAKSGKSLYQIDKDHWVIHAARFNPSEVEIHLVTNWNNMILHWGLFELYNENHWILPPEPFPINSNRASNSLDTMFVEDLVMHSDTVYNVHIKIYNPDHPKIGGMIFALRRYNAWYNNLGKNYRIRFN